MTDGSLTEVSNAVKTVTIDDKEYKFARLLLEDHAEAEQFIKDQRQRNCQAGMAGMPMGEEARGLAIAKAAGDPAPLDQIIVSPTGRMKLIHLALRRADPQGPKTIPAIATETLGEIIVFICNLNVPEVSAASDPTATTAK